MCGSGLNPWVSAAREASASGPRCHEQPCRAPSSSSIFPDTRVLIAFNKPFGVICKFRPEPGRTTQTDYIKIPDVYPACRLDTDSEGLLLLTDDGLLQARISRRRHKLAKIYRAQVE